MKSSCMFVCVLALAMGFSSAADAGLLSLYTFDDTANNAVSGAPNGTLAGDAGHTTGKVGTKALLLDGNGDYVDLGTSGIPVGSQMANGSIAFWLNSSSTTEYQTILNGAHGSSGTYFVAGLSGPYSSVGQITLYVRSSAYNTFHAYGGSNLNDGVWHQVVLSWNAVGGSGVSDLAMYVDGDAATTTIATQTITASDTFSNWDNPVRIGATGRSTVTGNLFDGALDDVGVWSDQLDATEAKSLYSLAANTVLNYNAKDAQTLFDIYAGGAGTTGMTSDGETWQYVTGLTGTPGTVVNNDTLILGVGVGVQIVPEPSAAIILITGIVGLLAYAWRKRK